MIGAALGVGGGHRHHEARRAETALATVMLDHRLLDGMQRATLGQSLDRAHGAARELRQKQDAGVERAQPPLGIGDDHRAGAAIAFVAALLGAG